MASFANRSSKSQGRPAGSAPTIGLADGYPSEFYSQSVGVSKLLSTWADPLLPFIA